MTKHCVSQRLKVEPGETRSPIQVVWFKFKEEGRGTHRGRGQGRYLAIKVVVFPLLRGRDFGLHYFIQISFYCVWNSKIWCDSSTPRMN